MSLLTTSVFDGLRMVLAATSQGGLSHDWQMSLSVLRAGVFDGLRTLTRKQAAVLGGLSLATIATSAWWVSRRTPRRLADGDRRLCIVTGAASGIGLATVLRLEELGWHVLAIDIDEGKLADLSASTSGKVRVLRCDVTSSTSCEALVQHAKDLAAELGLPGIAALTNVAGVMQHCPAAEVEESQLKMVFAVNCEAPVRLIRMLMPLLLATEKPTVCNVSSLTADTPLLWSGCYSGTKGFLANYSDSLRREAAASGLPLRVCCIKPGFISTPLTDALMQRQLKWCEENQQSPFQPTMHAASTFNHHILTQKEIPNMLGKLLKVFGDPKAPFANPPEDVAEDIARALSVSSPSRYYCTGTIAFKIMIGCITILPGAWEDWAIKYIC